MKELYITNIFQENNLTSASKGGYKDKPDYQLLKGLLSHGGTGKLDLSRPGDPAGPSTTKTREPPIKTEKKGRGRGKAEAKAADDDDDDDDDEDEMKPKPVQARYIRGPPKTRAQSQQQNQRKSRASPAVGRSTTRSTKPQPNYNDDDNDEEEEEDEEEQEARPKPIPACYLRGPPIGPRAPKNQAKPKRTVRRSDDLTPKQEVNQQPHPQRTTHTSTVNGDIGTHTHKDYWERWDDGRLRQHRQDPQWNGQLWRGHTDGLGGWEGSSGQNAGPTHGTGLLNWFVCAGVCVFLAALSVIFLEV